MNQHIKDAAAHADACKTALMDAYKAAVNSGNGMAAYAIELVLREASAAVIHANNLVAASEPERSGQ